MRILRLLSLFLLAGLLPVGLLAPVAAGGDAAAQGTARLVGIRAAHHPGFDEIVFRFEDGFPSRVQIGFSKQLIQDGSGLPIPIAGRAVLGVSFFPATTMGGGAPARRAFALPNIMTVIRSGDFEAVTSYGIGLAKQTGFQLFLERPHRVVIDIGAGFRTVKRKVFFFNPSRFDANTPPFVTPRLRPVRPVAPATGVMDRLFAGPLPSERADGLRLVRSEATGFSHLSISDGIARVRLTGGCNAHGSTATIANEIMPTLRQFDSVNWVKIYGPHGHTSMPTGHSDSIPACLNP